MAKADQTNGNEAAEGGAKKGRQGWSKIQTDRKVIGFDRGKGNPVQGVLLGIQDMPPANGKRWQAFIIRLTEPVSGKDKDGKPIECKKDEEILVPANHQTMQHLGRAALHPSLMFEVRIAPAGQRKTNAGSMTLFDLEVNETPLRRGSSERMMAAQGAAPRLPEHAGDTAPSDDIPF